MRRLWEEGMLRSLPDLYRLTAEQLMQLDGYGEISANNAVQAIAESKRVPFSRVLFGLNIPQLGWVTAQSLARHFGSVDELLEATQEDVEQVEGIGPDRAEAIVDWFADDQNRALIEELRSLGIIFELSDEERPKEGPLKGNTYVITGTLESMSREQAAAALEELGAKITSAVSAKTTALIAGEEPGNSKLTKAQKVGTDHPERAGTPGTTQLELGAAFSAPKARQPALKASRGHERSGPVPRAHTSKRAGGRSG